MLISEEPEQLAGSSELERSESELSIVHLDYLCPSTVKDSPKEKEISPQRVDPMLFTVINSSS